jgi:hypothetical protein
MQLALFVAADYANKSDLGKLNIMGIFNSIYSSGFPARHRQLFLVSRLVAELGEYHSEHEMKLLFVDEDGNELINQGGKISIERPQRGKQAIAEFIVDVGDLLLPKAGIYEFRLEINDELKGIILIEAILLENLADNQDAPQS